jgi:hypothetical protein
MPGVWALLPAFVAIVTFVAIVARAVRTVDVNWDTLAYHWVFAARAAGLCDRDCFMLALPIEPRYDGFPLLIHAAQGALWRLTGTPGMADLINIGMVVLLCCYLKWRFRVPLAWAWLALLAIPEVQGPLTTSLIDVPINAAITIAVLAFLRMLQEPAEDHLADSAIALAALGVAAGGKLQMVPVAMIIWAGIVVLALRDPSRLRFTRRSTLAIALIVAAIMVVLPKVIINALRFGNPFYPIALVFGPFHFAGPEPMVQPNILSDAWIDVPGPMRWIASVLEFDAFRGRPLPWMPGQADVLQESPSFRMGGYFVAYVLSAIAVVVWVARSSRKARWPLATLVVFSVLCASFPYSSELRYYLFWMMSLVSIMLALTHAPQFENPLWPIQRGVARGAIAIAFTSVVAMTGGYYFRLDGITLAQLTQGIDAIVAHIPEGATLCIRNSDRRAVLYSALFHPPRKYHTRQLQFDEPAEDCTIRLTIDD